jgi:hypothetical protein
MSVEEGEDIQLTEQMGEGKDADEIDNPDGTQRSCSRSKKDSSEDENNFEVLKEKLLK